jgi:tetratricopeptide (TPR) repeat protein
MPSPSHRPNSFKANRVFTDRDTPRALFVDAYNKLQNADEYRVLNFTGIGGQGKSALCGEFEKYLIKQQTDIYHPLAWAKLNFEDNTKRQPVAALLSLRFQLADTGKIWFPAFDLAFSRYFALTQAGRDLKTAHPELFKQPHDLLQEAATATEGLSGVPLLGFLLKKGYQAQQYLKLEQWKTKRGDALLADLENFAPYELESKLAMYLGADIADWLHTDLDQKPRRVVLLYDTYEALWRDHPLKTDILVDKWVRNLVAETPEALHVILGRDALIWETYEPQEWQGIITHEILDNLSDADAEQFLLAVPIEEAAIRERIIAGANGIPFYLNLQVDQYESSQRQDQIPNPNDYGGQEPELLIRFMNHLPDAMRQALRVASCAQWLDEALFLALSEKFLGGKASISFHELTLYSFWTNKNQRYYLHNVMRDYLQITYRTQEALLYEQVHKYLFTHYDQALSALTSARELTDLHGEALLQGIYHLEQYEYQQYPYWLSQYTKFFYRAGYYALLDNPLERALITLREIGDKAGEGATLNNISQIYDARGDYDTALTYLQQSLSIRQQIGDKAGEGTTLNNMATTAYARGDYDTALTYLQQSLSIRQQIGDKAGEGATLNNISQIYDARGDYDTALTYLQQSLSIRQQIGDKAGLCATLFNTGRLHWQNEATEQAIGSWVTVYVIAKQINLAQALAALEELAEQLDLPNGLEGWEALAEKLKTASELSLP